MEYETLARTRRDPSLTTTATSNKGQNSDLYTSNNNTSNIKKLNIYSEPISEQESYYNDNNIHILDNTRIHPECYITYDFIQKICSDSLEQDFNHKRPYLLYIKVIENCKVSICKQALQCPQWLDLWGKGVRPSGEYYG